MRIKLDAMENPFPLPAQVRDDIAKAVRRAALNRYPDPSAEKLTKAIAAVWRMHPSRMLLGNGSDELIQNVVIAFGGPVLVPTPSFAMYDITPRVLSQDVVTVPLTGEFDLDADAVIAKARKTGARVIFLACPNNPTGNRFSDEAVRRVLENVNAIVVIDEAYYSFSGRSFLRWMPRHPNMIILRTLSKIGLAGLRIGVMTAAPQIIAEINKVRLPYNINALSQAAALTALKYWNVLSRQVAMLIEERKALYQALLRTPGVTPFPSETNFLLIWIERDASRVFRELRRRGILVKNLDRPGRLAGCLRVTVGTPEENRAFLNNLKQIL